MFDDVTGPQQRHLHMYPIILTSSYRRHNTLSIKGKNFSKYRYVQGLKNKTWLFTNFKVLFLTVSADFGFLACSKISNYRIKVHGVLPLTTSFS